MKTDDAIMVVKKMLVRLKNPVVTDEEVDAITILMAGAKVADEMKGF